MGDMADYYDGRTDEYGDDEHDKSLLRTRNLSPAERRRIEQRLERRRERQFEREWDDQEW